MREFKSAPLEGTENVSVQYLRKSLLRSKSPPPFSGASTKEKKNQPLLKKEKNKQRIIKACLPTSSGNEDKRTGPTKLMQKFSQSNLLK